MLTRTALLCVVLAQCASSYNSQREDEPWITTRLYRPVDFMVDITNALGIDILYEHNFLNDNNIAFSPYGLTGILIALYEGVDGVSSIQIKQALGLPNDRNVVRIGFRDIHRRLRSYFIPKEGFLAGLSFNNENVTFKKEYRDILQFYGYDFDMPKAAGSNGTTSTSTTATQSTEAISTMMSTTPMTTVAQTTSPPITTLMTSASTNSETTVTSAMSTTTENVVLAITMDDQTTTPKVETETPASDSTDSTADTTITTSALVSTVASTIETTSETSSKTTSSVVSTTASSTATSAETSSKTTSSVVSTTASSIATSAETSSETTSAAVSTMASTIETTSEVSTTKVTTESSLETLDETNSPSSATLQQSSTLLITSPKPTQTETTSSTLLLTSPTEEPETTTSRVTRTTRSEPSTIATTKQMSIVEATTSDNESEESDTTNTPTEDTESTTESFEATSVPGDETTMITTTEPADTSRERRSILHYDYIEPPFGDQFAYFRPFFSNNNYDQGSLHYQRSFLANGFDRVQVTYMTYDTVLDFAYIPYLRSSALKLPLDTSEYYLLILLPEYEFGLNRLIKDLKTSRAPSLTQINYMLNPTHVRAWIPTFMLRGFIVLTTDLQKIGVCDVFEPRHDDFKPMTDERNIYVRNIEQSITVTIRKYMEPGVKKRYIHQQSPVEFAATHPFLYFVMDAGLHVSLMAGKMVNPLNSRII